jgi:hypothetical protein
MKFKVITSWNTSLHKAYAYRFNETYNWPFPVEVYNEDTDFFEKVPDCRKFVMRNKVRPVKNFLFDGVRFCYKVYAYTHAILTSKEDGIIWLDADSIFHIPIEEKWFIENVHRDNCMTAYLGRGGMYSECGFLYFNMKHSQIKNFATELKLMYDEDKIYNEIEHHDSYIFDVVRKKFENEYGVKNHNLGDEGKAHVQQRSVLGKIYDHAKGNRKYEGGSGHWKRNRRP